MQENDEPVPKITVWTRGIPDGKESLAPAIPRDLDTYNVPRIPQDLDSTVTFLLSYFELGFCDLNPNEGGGEEKTMIHTEGKKTWNIYVGLNSVI